VPADPWAVTLMQELKLDISGHRGRQVTMPMLRAADLVLVMDVPQQRQLEAYYPAGRGKISRFCHFGGKDVPDPHREGEQAFRWALQLIESGVSEWAERLTRLSRKSMVREVA
jgi:protein-tyrosine phosphatase